MVVLGVLCGSLTDIRALVHRSFWVVCVKAMQYAGRANVDRRGTKATVSLCRHLHLTRTISWYLSSQVATLMCVDVILARRRCGY